MMPLTMTRSGDTANIQRIAGKDETRRHLENLGFVVGENVTVVNEIAGNIILNVRGTRVAIDKAMANRIMVSPCDCRRAGGAGERYPAKPAGFAHSHASRGW